MVHGRLGLIAVCLVVGCTVGPGEGAVTFGATGMDASEGGSSTPASEGGSSGAPGSGDEGDEGEDEAGSADPGSTSAASTDPGSEATTEPGGESSAGSEEGGSESEGGPPLEEHDYGPCGGGDPESPCGDDAECIVVEGLNGSFCSPWCDEDLACPEPTAGEAFAQCQLGPDLSMDPVHCALLCDPGSDECPGGMTCVDTGMPIGVCLFQG